jgi:hypothetical protein
MTPAQIKEYTIAFEAYKLSHHKTLKDYEPTLEMMREDTHRRNDQEAYLPENYTDFKAQCYIIVCGHSTITRENLSHKLNVPPNIKQVSLLLAEPGIMCFLNKIYSIDVDIIKNVVTGDFSLSPRESLIVFNKSLKDITAAKTAANRTFNRSPGYISNDPEHYFEKSWELFTSNKDLEGHAGESNDDPDEYDGESDESDESDPIEFGGVWVYYKNKLIGEIGPLVTVTKTEVLSFASDKLYEHTSSAEETSAEETSAEDTSINTVFIDIGCCGFETEDAKLLWAQMIQAKKSNMGGNTKHKKRRRVSRVNRKVRLCL